MPRSILNKPVNCRNMYLKRKASKQTSKGGGGGRGEGGGAAGLAKTIFCMKFWKPYQWTRVRTCQNGHATPMKLGH